MKQKSLNYLLATHNIFHPGEIPLFETFDAEHSSILWKSLYLNAAEVLTTNSFPAIFILDESDVDFLPDKLKVHSDNIYFTDIKNTETLFSKINEKYFSETENNILFLFNAIGYTQLDVQKTTNLLSINDDALVLARSGNNLCFTGFNRYDNFLNTNYSNYEEVLVHSCRAENYIYTLDNYLSINDINDFKKLYTELSRKESLSYCSHEMHEQFTHLFIEYKELLK